MLNWIIDFSLKHRFVVIAVSLALAVWGGVFRAMAICLQQAVAA